MSYATICPNNELRLDEYLLLNGFSDLPVVTYLIVSEGMNSVASCALYN